MNFKDDLKRNSQDPEFVAYFANAQAESSKELLKCGVITELDSTSQSNKTYKDKYEEENRSQS